MSDEEKWPHTLTIQYLEKERPDLISKILTKILDESALTSRQGGAINYYWILDQIESELRRG